MLNALSPYVFRVAAIVLCTASVQAQSWGPIVPPPYGAYPGVLTGQVLGVVPASYNIAALIFVEGLGFYSKPYCNATTTPLNPDGTFSVLLTTGGIDQDASLIALLVVPASVSVPCYTTEVGVPFALEEQALLETIISRPNPNQKVIEFAGENWIVKSLPAPVGPGPNLFSDSPQNVFVDASGSLHLLITNQSGQWYSSEVISADATNHGRYTVTVDSILQFDPNVVFGAFSWADATVPNSEIDLLELGQFGNPSDPNNAQNVVQPYTIPGNQMRFFLQGTAPTVHQMTWLPDAVSFLSSDASGNILHEGFDGGQPPPAGSPRLNFRLNFWLFNGSPPLNGSQAEIVISGFSSVPADGPALFLQNQSNNGVSAWFMGPSVGSGTATIESSPWFATAAAGWTLAAVADMNGDGIPDLIFQNPSTGGVSIWFMTGWNGLTISSAPIIYTAAPQWQLVAAADMNGDGEPDLIFENSVTNQISIWFMNPGGTTFSSAPIVAAAASGWKIAATGDINQDGMTDLLLQNRNTGEVSVWFMNSGGTSYSWAPIVASPAAGWTLVGTSDFNDDGIPDYIFQNRTTGQVSVWYMTGNRGTTYSSAPVIATALPDWSVLAAH
jgi:hypothetical protein